MIKLLLIADDFTGALDTGVQFTNAGAKVSVVTLNENPFIDYNCQNIDVVVANLNTRHLPRDIAYQRVFQITKQSIEANVPLIYKKTDSALRGNIGAELKALLDASGASILPFAPALPSMNRITKNGVHYIDNIPIAESVFGKDPFEPVKCSYVKSLFNSCDVNVINAEKGKMPKQQPENTIIIYDADSSKDFDDILANLKIGKDQRILSGCAGFASSLAKYLNFTNETKKLPRLKAPMLIVCGSLNPISKKQTKHAISAGIDCTTISISQHTGKNYFSTSESKELINSIETKMEQKSAYIIETDGDLSELPQFNTETARHYTSDFLGELAYNIISKSALNTVLIIGGDTLLGFVEKANCKKIKICGELCPGTVLTEMIIDENRVFVLTKSGGFGKKTLITDIIKNHLDKVENVE